jgi:hypothetical protein
VEDGGGASVFLVQAGRSRLVFAAVAELTDDDKKNEKSADGGASGGASGGVAAAQAGEARGASTPATGGKSRSASKPTADGEDDDEESDEEEESEEESEEEAEGEAGAEEGEEAEAKATDEEATTEEARRENRRERRRRRKRGEAGDEPLDRNARVRARLQKKRTEAERVVEPLSTTEMLDDASARAFAAAGKWASRNATTIAALVLVAILGGAGYGGWNWYSMSKIEEASTELTAGVQADRGRVDEAPAPKAGEEELTPVFKTNAARADAALDGYRKARSIAPSSGAAILARLGEAGILLDKQSYDEALAAYREVKASPLAAADPDVRGRAIEGAAFAIEAKGDKDAALKAFKELDSVVGIHGFQELGMYHQARLLALKGDAASKEQALKLLKDAKEKIQTSGESSHVAYLTGVVEELQHTLDPSTAPKKSVAGPNRQISQEDIDKMLQKMKQQAGQHEDEH